MVLLQTREDFEGLSLEYLARAEVAVDQREHGTGLPSEH